MKISEDQHIVATMVRKNDHGYRHNLNFLIGSAIHTKKVEIQSTNSNTGKRLVSEENADVYSPRV